MTTASRLRLSKLKHFKPFTWFSEDLQVQGSSSTQLAAAVWPLCVCMGIERERENRLRGKKKLDENTDKNLIFIPSLIITKPAVNLWISLQIPSIHFHANTVFWQLVRFQNTPKCSKVSALTTTTTKKSLNSTSQKGSKHLANDNSSYQYEGCIWFFCLRIPKMIQL